MMRDGYFTVCFDDKNACTQVDLDAVVIPIDKDGSGNNENKKGKSRGRRKARGGVPRKKRRITAKKGKDDDEEMKDTENEDEIAECGCEEGFIKTRKLEHALPRSLLVCQHCKVCLSLFLYVALMDLLWTSYGPLMDLLWTVLPLSLCL